MVDGSYSVGSMFAGIGGICLAFKDAGAKVVWANEINADACRTYRNYFGDGSITMNDLSSSTRRQTTSLILTLY